MIDWRTVASSAIRRVGYDDDNSQMKIQFVEGDIVYTFCRVPRHVFDELVRAESAGRYYTNHVRNKYQC
ncbi:KTSC domain-containing protein [Cobetia amphilecti]|uniref:KTSC domain-containing protein n=1 Tax=Cobetia amphilecti TaxID=1055104 RepID=UPI003D66368A